MTIGYLLKTIKDYQLYSLLEVVIEGLEVNILEKIKIVRSKNKEVVRVIEEIIKAGVKVLKGEEQQIERDLVLKEGRIYIPKDKVLRVEMIWLHHNIPVAGYRGK